MIAIDGKTVRGARTRPDGAAPHLLAAFDHTAGVVLGQLAVAAKSNEIPCVRDLITSPVARPAVMVYRSRAVARWREFAMQLGRSEPLALHSTSTAEQHPAGSD